MTYEETVAHILDIPKFATKNEPSHTREFLKSLGEPQESFPVIHVAGSNGKGSVCAFLGSILQESGLTVGLFTSPHLVSIRERFQVNGKNCSREQFLQAEAIVNQAVENMQQAGMAHPTFFEYMFALGMVLFQQAGVDCALVETGLGGRLDATNVVQQPLLTIITSISLEHTEYLGDTIAAIAGEKAGIIKPGVPVIFDGSEPEAEAVIVKTAGEKHAPAEKISMDKINILLKDGKSIDFSMESEYDVTSVRIPFPAEYQVMNAALALAGAKRLKEVFAITDRAIRSGLGKAAWPGRMEELYPDVYLDGAHNSSGIRAFLKAVSELAQEPPLLLFSMVKDKKYQEAVQLLCQEGNWESIILTELPDNPRALKLEQLKECFAEALEEKEAAGREKKPRILAIAEPREAFAKAQAERRLGQKLFCAGSLYLVGELKKIAGGYQDDKF